MIHPHRTPYYRADDKELLGFLAQDTVGWQAQTVFGYTISRTATEADAQRVLREQGLAILMGVWQYFDGDDHQWHSCVLKEAQEHRVTVIRTNAMGYQDPDDYKLYVIKDPTDNTLVKA